MLGKLIKYDFRSCWKKFWPVWLAVLVISIINGWSLAYCEKYSIYTFMMDAFPKLVLFGIAIAAIVIAIMYIYNEFAHGLLGDQGYLAFTLPAKPEELIASKAITALILEAISAVLVAICVVLMASIASFTYILDFFADAFRMMAQSGIPVLIVMIIIEGIILLAVTAVTFNFHIYTAASIGHLSKKSRKLVGILSFIGISILTIFLSSNIAFPLIDEVWNLLRPLPDEMLADVYSAMISMGILILGQAIYSAVMFFAVRWIISHKLNLE